MIGGALLLPALLLPRLAQHAIAGTSLLLATALVNLIPENPYLPFDRRLAGFSNVFSFHGLTGLVDSLWLYAALAYLSALGLWRGRAPRGRPCERAAGSAPPSPPLGIGAAAAARSRGHNPAASRTRGKRRL